jgi:peptide/nickel transport system substrate-binding protein
MSKLGILGWLSMITLMSACSGGQPAEPGGAGAPQQPAAKKHIVAAVSAEPTTLSDTLNAATPGGSAGAPELELLVHGGLSLLDDHGVRVPRFASAVPNIDDGSWVLFPDGRMRTRYQLRPNLRWHDGVAFTADDLAFTARVAQDADVGVLRHPGFAAVDRVDVQAPDTVVVSWKNAFIDADSMFSDRFAVPLPQHLLEQAYLADKTSFAQLPYWTQAFVGAGPFAVSSFVPGSYMLLTANDAYVLGRPHIDEIEVKFILDPNALMANVLAGVVELNLGRGLSVEQATQVVGQWPEGHLDSALYNVFELLPQHIAPNPAVLANVEFRRALLHASDRQQLVDSLLSGLTSVAYSTIVVPNQREYPYVEPYIVRYAYDPRAAVDGIAGLGYTRGADGRFRDGADQPLVLEIRTTSTEDLTNKLMLSIRDQWQSVGIGVDTLVIPAQRRQDLEYRDTRPGFEISMQRPLMAHYQSKEVPRAENNFRGDNPTRYASAELDEYIDRYLGAMPWNVRMDALGQIARHLSSEVVDMGILHPITPTLIANRLSNVSAAKSVPPANQAWNAHAWDAR